MGAGPLVVAATGVAMLAWSWRTWPDVIVDFGRELYVPWQLLEGRRLYADIAHFNGPLSPYLNALWFALFGASVRTLVVCNVLILAVLVALLYRIIREIAGPIAAATAGVTFLVLFACGQLMDVGNYNFVCPYSHELTHGLVLSVAAIYATSRYHRHGLLAVAGGGLALGLVFLTKPEVFAAALAGVVVALASTMWMARVGPRRGAAMLATLAGTTMLGPVAAVLLLARVMPARQALLGVAGGWPWVLGGNVLSAPYYRRGMGTLETGAALARMLEVAAVSAVALVPLAGVALVLRRSTSRVVKAAAVLAVVTLGAAAWAWSGLEWFDVGRPLPLAMGLLGVAGGVRFARRPAPRLVVLLSMVTFAAVLLGKILLNARFHQYGFALAAPATVLAVGVLVGLVPAAIDRRGGDGWMFRAGALALLLVCLVTHLRVFALWFEQKTHLVGGGPDAFLADNRGPIVTDALAEIARHVRPGETLAVLPEGVMLNYLARRRTPVRYINFMPVELLLFGEDAMLAALAAAPPDFVALVYKDTAEYGARFFGTDYGRNLAAWVAEHYRQIAVLGTPPSRNERFGVALLERDAKGGARMSNVGR